MLPDVARRLLADRPCRELGGDLRYGSRGSLVVHPHGTWHDFEAGAGGGTLALVEHVLQTDRAGAADVAAAILAAAVPADDSPCLPGAAPNMAG